MKDLNITSKRDFLLNFDSVVAVAGGVQLKYFQNQRFDYLRNAIITLSIREQEVPDEILNEFNQLAAALDKRPIEL